MREKYKGRFIVIEGTDGSGKGTQFKLLVAALRCAGNKVETLDFPQYGKKSAYFVEQYLNGNYGASNKVSPYIASLFYALDRYSAKEKLITWLGQGKVVVANRFTLSNAAHQGGKIKSARELKKYWRWLFNLEYKVFGLPRPDLTLLIHMPAAVAQKLVLKKLPRQYLRVGGKRDIHEADLGHLQAAEQKYLSLAKLVKAELIKSVSNNEILTPKVIHNKVWNKVNQFLKQKKRIK